MKKDARFVCIDYPCVVKNEEKMLDTLGGEKNLSKVHILSKVTFGSVNLIRTILHT